MFTDDSFITMLTDGDDLSRPWFSQGELYFSVCFLSSRQKKRKLSYKRKKNNDGRSKKRNGFYVYFAANLGCRRRSSLSFFRTFHEDGRCLYR